jgi:hypothetical protein
MALQAVNCIKWIILLTSITFWQMKQYLMVNSTLYLVLFASLTHPVGQTPSGIRDDYQYQHLKIMTTVEGNQKPAH